MRSADLGRGTPQNWVREQLTAVETPLVRRRRIAAATGEGGSG